MGRQLAILLDAPADAANVVQIAKLGDNFTDPRYGKFSITKDMVEGWKRNLEKLPGGRAVIDEDHLADKPSPFRRTEASGWITGFELDGETPRATVEWTPKGKAAILEKRYLFLSPVFGDHTLEDGTVVENVCTGAALTNKPFLDMPMVQLAAAERVDQALDADPVMLLEKLALEGVLGDEMKTLAGVTQDERDKAKSEGNSLPDKSYPIRNVSQLKAAIVLAQSGHGDAAAAKSLIIRRAGELGRNDLLPDGWGGSGKSLDSRGQMKITLDTLKARGITDDAKVKAIIALAEAENPDAVKILEAIDEATPKAEPAKTEPTPAEKSAERKALEAQAGEQGLMILDADQALKLLGDAAKGAQAHETLTLERFDVAWNKALEATKAVPAQEDFYRTAYGVKPAETLKALEDAPPLLNVKPSGKNVSTDELTAPSGVDPDSFALDAQVQAYMTENKLGADGYLKALEAVTGTKLGVS